MRSIVLVLGNQLFPHANYSKWRNLPFFMAEDFGLCTYTKHHKQKLLLFLVAMRHFRDQLIKSGHIVHYCELQNSDSQVSFEDKLLDTIKKEQANKIICFEIEDHFFAERIEKFCSLHSITLEIHTTPMFICSREEFSAYLAKSKKPFMKTFYEHQRRRLGILMKDGEPIGGKYSFDDQNRKKLPKNYAFQAPPSRIDSPHLNVVKALIEKHFKNHPGSMEEFIWPVTREQAVSLLNDFIEHKIMDFGPYQDSMTTRSAFVNHSLISAALNIGLLTPVDIIDRLPDHKNIALNSIEGFVRQVVGWREFVRGIYHNFSEQMVNKNHWQHTRKGSSKLYSGQSGIFPLDDVIQKVWRYGYGHHIERLMILANFFNLCELDPTEIYTWFMNHFIDSSDWVMQANVYGMGLMSDGGIFATKPYISGSNYLRKMSDYKLGDWCNIWDGLYWRFIDQKKLQIMNNPRMAMMAKMLEKMDKEKRKNLLSTADIFLEEFTSQAN